MTDKKSKKYNNLKLSLSIIESVLSFLILLLLVLFKGTKILESFVQAYIHNEYLALFVFVMVLGVILSLLLFPISFYREFLLEHKYGLSNQTLKKYFWEKIKGLMVALPILLVLLAIFYFLLKGFPSYWWFIMGTVIVFFSVILSRLAPTLIFPLFYKFVPLENEELKERIEELCTRSGMELEGLFKFDMSKNTKKANAAFTGIGKSKRIILGDTLMESLSEKEILSVLAHELGHFKLKHIWKGMALGILMNYLGLWLVDLGYSQVFQYFGNAKHSLAALPIMALILTIFSVITGPISNIYSRKNEREADDYAAETMKTPEYLISGLNKLNEQNLGDEDPHPMVEFLFHSHPSTKGRVARLNEKSN